jgi:hypothetical protein
MIIRICTIEELNNSIFTSWTSDIWVANFFANKKGKGGIILVKRFHFSELTLSPDIHKQGEFLVRGTVVGAVPLETFDPKP